MSENYPPIVLAAQSKTTLEAALAYARLGFSVLPLVGKKPPLPTWVEFQEKAADAAKIKEWHRDRQLKNVGILCGAVSNNLVVLDFDGAGGYPAFAATFPHLTETYTVATGGGIGKHIYWFCNTLSDTVKSMETPIGNLELRANGMQVAAPPSIHPDTKKCYKVEKPLDVLLVPDLKEVVDWIEAFRPQTFTISFPTHTPSSVVSDGKLNPQVVETLQNHFAARGYKPMGDWLHGTCVYPERHKNGDRHPSFGFNVVTGYGNCFRCGTILAKDICATVGIDTASLGGLMQSDSSKVQQSSIRLSDAPEDAPSVDELSIEEEMLPPDDITPDLQIADLKLPDWLQKYLNWSGTTGNQTPISFHLAAGLWLLATALGRRLYAESPWGLRIYPNLYLMLIAGTTYYRKSTAYKLAEQIAQQAIHHMLMPTPGSPERFLESLSGKMPANFDKLSKLQQERLTKAQPFAAQRGLLKDEVAGLFGAINRREYMAGMKDLLMELYDCPDYSDKDTQAGLTIVENAALSILGVTTPAGLSNSITDADWSNGLLIRFGLITPEPEYKERPAAITYQPVPVELVESLRYLHEKLPAPQMTEMGWSSPAALKVEVDCWEDIQAYSEHLRQLCNPYLETEIDERLKGVYGRMHVQALKVAMLLAAMEWMNTDNPAPRVTKDCWAGGKAVAELWRASAAVLLSQIDKDSEVIQERREENRLLDAVRSAGVQGISFRDAYRKLNLPSKRARLLAQDLVKAGLIVEMQNGRAEWYVAARFIAED